MRFDILAFNKVYGRLFDDLESMPFEDRNSLWLAFTHPAWRRAVLDREDALCRMVAQYRAAMAEHVAEPAWKCLVKRLQTASPEFTAMWERHEVAGPEAHHKRFRQPQVGLLRLDYTYLWLGPSLGTRMITYTPVDEETARRLERLCALVHAEDGADVRAEQR
jgi:MmyB-like transcription regulator ligand binding domain